VSDHPATEEMSDRAKVAGFGNAGAFALMAVIWGGTWAAVKVGVTAVPPIFFAFLRYALVAAILAVTVRGVAALPDRKRLGRIIVTGLLINTGTYALLFWGMQFIPSGVSGLVNLSLIPVGLFSLSILFGDERPSWLHGAALVLGIAGLALLFSNKASLSGNAAELQGAAAIVVGTFCYCLGTMLSRPLLETLAPMQIAGAQATVGAAGLLAASVMLEPVSMETLRAVVSPAPLTGLIFLVLLGTIVAYAIYLRLVRDWGASKAGLYAFVSPVVALAVGWLLFGEAVTWREIAGAAILLIAAGLAMRSQRHQRAGQSC
jgi:drug/metabolite transporter (DMT)-like permease